MTDLDEEVESPDPTDTTWWERRGDLAVAILLSTVTLLLAWSGFQAGKWSGVQAINFSDAGKARTDSNALTDLGSTAVAIDVSIFVAWLEAVEPELEEAESVEDITTGDGLAPFLYQGFPDRLRIAVDDWLQLRLESPDVEPGLPFELDSYVVAEFVRAAELRDEASAFGDAARQNNQQSDIYVLATVVFASGLFLAGISQKMASMRTQQAVFGLAVLVAFFGAIVVFTQPIEFTANDLPW